MRKCTITKRDFDNAAKQPWDSATCIVAQCMKRNGMETGIYARPTPSCIVLKPVNSEASEAMRIFDLYFRKPGDEHTPNMKELRASLPIPINLPD